MLQEGAFPHIHIQMNIYTHTFLLLYWNCVMTGYSWTLHDFPRSCASPFVCLYILPSLMSSSIPTFFFHFFSFPLLFTQWFFAAHTSYAVYALTKMLFFLCHSNQFYFPSIFVCISSCLILWTYCTLFFFTNTFHLCVCARVCVVLTYLHLYTIDKIFHNRHTSHSQKNTVIFNYS